MPEPNETPTPNPAPAAAEANGSPSDAEARLKDLETKYDAAVKEMNAAQRERAEAAAKYEAEAATRAAYQAQLASLQTRPDPNLDLQNQIVEAQKGGDYERASALSLQLQNQKAVEMIQASATIGLMNSVNQALSNPTLSDDAKQVLRESVYEGGDPKRGLRQDKLQELLATSIKPGAFEEMVQVARERAEGRNVISGKTKAQLMQEWTAEQEKRKKEAEMASSLTTGGSGAPPMAIPGEKVKELEKKVHDSILSANVPPI